MKIYFMSCYFKLEYLKRLIPFSTAFCVRDWSENPFFLLFSVIELVEMPKIKEKKIVT